MKLSDLLTQSLKRIVTDILRPSETSPQVKQNSSQTRSSSRDRKPSHTSRRKQPHGPTPTSDYPGDYEGYPQVEYAPHTTPRPDPGEIAWGWVPYEEDHNQGKDRPVLLIGRDGDWLLGLPLSSVDHRKDAAQEASQGRYWVEIGSGEWDAQRRVSAVRVDRIVRFDPAGMRRVAGELDAQRFDAVIDGLARHWNA